MPRAQSWHEAHQILKEDLNYLYCDLKLAKGLSSFLLRQKTVRAKHPLMGIKTTSQPKH